MELFKSLVLVKEPVTREGKRLCSLFPRGAGIEKSTYASLMQWPLGGAFCPQFLLSSPSGSVCLMSE